jgi:hypothetical protein
MDTTSNAVVTQESERYAKPLQSRWWPHSYDRKIDMEVQLPHETVILETRVSAFLSSENHQASEGFLQLYHGSALPHLDYLP